MLYKRSSFIKYLREKHDCEIIPLGNTRGVLVKHGPQSVYLWTDKHDRIDYEEIYVVYQKLLIVGLPGDSDLERIE